MMGLLALTDTMIAAEFEEVSFETSDGGKVYANHYGNGSHAVVLGHGGVFNKESWHELAIALKSEGLRVLAIDFRGYGKSVKGRRAEAKHLDLLAALDFLTENGAERVSLLGGSMGGGAAAQAAVDSKSVSIAKLVLLAHVPVNTPKKLKGDKLFIVSEGDRFAKSTREQFEKAPIPKRLEILPGDAHAQHIFKTDQAERLEKLIVEFLTD